MTIEVSWDDIARGTRCHPSACPVSRAIARHGIQGLAVMYRAVVVIDSGGLKTALLLPRHVTEWLLAFDQGQPVDPIQFQIGLPVPAGGSIPAWSQRDPQDVTLEPEDEEDAAAAVSRPQLQAA